MRTQGSSPSEGLCEVELHVEAKIFRGSPVALRAQEIGEAGRDRGRGQSEQHVRGESDGLSDLVVEEQSTQ